MKGSIKPNLFNALAVIFSIFGGKYVIVESFSNSLGSGNGRQVEAGINLATDAYEAVCWYEYLKQYIPQTRSLDFNQCHGQANFQKNIVFKHGAPERFYGQFLSEHGMHKLPQQYMQCSRYLLHDRRSKHSRDYSKAFNVSNYKSVESSIEVPYESFAHCLLTVIHEKYGEEGLFKISERLQKDKPWAETMFERENEFRALHGVDPLKIHDELTYRAQKWADQLARSCAMYHIHSSHPDFKLNGSRMGENLFTGDNIHSPREDMALFGTNIWYEEIMYYPWPEYKGYGSDPFLKFSHFSQMIWKDTKMVGYGFAANMSENCGQYFIVSRYFPPGNFWDQFGENVRPLVGVGKKKKNVDEIGVSTTSGNTDGTTTFTTNRS